MSAGITVYPCDRGTGTPQGWHHFQANTLGVICCTLCGSHPVSRATLRPTPYDPSRIGSGSVVSPQDGSYLVNAGQTSRNSTQGERS